MKIWKFPVDLEVITERGKNTLSDFLGIEFTDVGDDFMTASLQIKPHHKQPAGIMHGGISCTLAETIGSTAAQFCVDYSTYYCVGLDINTNHIMAVREGLLTATARPFHLGKSTQVWGIDIVNDQGKLVSVNRLTMAVLERK